MSAHENNSGNEDAPQEGEWGVEHNPHGPWSGLKNEQLQHAIVRIAGKNFTPYTATHSNVSYADFLDVLTASWLEHKARVEDEASKHGFLPCADTDNLPYLEKQRAALLCLTLHGSFILLGNGCLTYAGGFGVYEKIPHRVNEGTLKAGSPAGVVVQGRAALQERLLLNCVIGSTSPLQMLYYTTSNLSPANAAVLCRAVGDSIHALNLTMTGALDETNQKTIEPPGHAEPAPVHVPQEIPEYV